MVHEMVKTIRIFSLLNMCRESLHNASFVSTIHILYEWHDNAFFNPTFFLSQPMLRSLLCCLLRMGCTMKRCLSLRCLRSTTCWAITTGHSVTRLDMEHASREDLITGKGKVLVHLYREDLITGIGMALIHAV